MPKAGSILISSDAEATDEYEEYGEEDHSGEDEDRESKMRGNEVRVYFDRAVKPSQARDAKVLGRITSNLKLVGKATPGGLYHHSGWGARYDEGMGIELSNVKFV